MPLNNYFTFSFSYLILILIFPHKTLSNGGGGQWQVLQQSIGISAMHMQLLNNDRVVIFDRSEEDNGNSSNNNLFIFANNRAILFDYNGNNVVKTYLTVPGGDPRNYPSTRSAALLPLESGANAEVDTEVLICGGAPVDSFWLAYNKSQFIPALNTCARIRVNDPNPTWIMEKMPMSRTMGDMILLPNGKVLIINGAGCGSAGWELGRYPVLSPVIYDPNGPLGSRFSVMTPTTIPRMYHSTAILLRDGRVLVGGSNPHEFYNFTNVLFPTDLSLEAYSPPYLDPANLSIRPNVVIPITNTTVMYGKILMVRFWLTGVINPGSVKITMIRPPFNTHSFSMSQRLIVLTNVMPVMPVGPHVFQVIASMQESANVAPPGYYMLFAIHQDIPSNGVWIQLV